jgi:hypothetical protein
MKMMKKNTFITGTSPGRWPGTLRCRLLYCIKLLWFGQLIFPLFASGQSIPATTTLMISTTDCREANRHGASQYKDTVRISRLNRPITFHLQDTMIYNHRLLKVDSCEIDTYTFSYRNIFNQVITKTVKLKDSSVNYIDLCPNRLKEYKETDLSAYLKAGDSVTIHYVYGGHRYSTDRKMIIRKAAVTFEALLYCNKENCGNAFPKWVTDSVKYILVKTVTLSEANISQLLEFENELNALPASSASCTWGWQSFYTFTKSNGKTSRCDCGNQWNGFDYLQKSLFGSIE